MLKMRFHSGSWTNIILMTNRDACNTHSHSVKDEITL